MNIEELCGIVKRGLDKLQTLIEICQKESARVATHECMTDERLTALEATRQTEGTSHEE